MARVTTTNPFAQAGRQVERSARAALASPWLERLARLGLAARGVVYALIGLLAVETAFGGRAASHIADTRGVLRIVAHQSRPLLWLLAVGLFGYALWRVVEGVRDPENRGSDAKGLAIRAGRVFSGLIYGGLAYAAARIAVGASGSSRAGGAQGWTAELMTKPFGRWLVAIAGLCVVGAGCAQIWKGWTAKFRKSLKLNEMSPAEQRLAIQSGRLGMIARGIVFLLSGWFLVQAAWRFDPGEARGLGGALEALARQPHGQALLAVVALGLVAFGAHSLMLARYRRIVL